MGFSRHYIQFLMTLAFLGLAACNEGAVADLPTDQVEKIEEFLGLPEMCLENAEFDADCDGFDDESGEYLY